MGKYDNTEGVSARKMVLFFMVDTSESMEGKKIGTLNEAVNNVIPEIRRISESSADAEIKIAVLRFSSDAEWIFPEPIEAEKFKWQYLKADGWTCFGEACRMLGEKLSRKDGGFMNAAAGSYAPAIFLLSDGCPNDEYQGYIEMLNNNTWFQNAIKVAVAIGDDVDEEILAEFTGSPDSVITVHTPEALGRMIEFVAVTASQIGSQSQNAGAAETTKQEAVTKQVQEYTSSSDFDLDEDDWN